MSVLVVGDFNFHYELKADRDTTRLVDMLNSANLQQCICDSTHVSGHTLDLVISRSADNIMSYVKASHAYQITQLCYVLSYSREHE